MFFISNYAKNGNKKAENKQNKKSRKSEKEENEGKGKQNKQGLSFLLLLKVWRCHTAFIFLFMATIIHGATNCDNYKSSQ